eukprot:scaffold67259_cov61-Phaeocystis_antarctica.AAC.4
MEKWSVCGVCGGDSPASERLTDSPYSYDDHSTNALDRVGIISARGAAAPPNPNHKKPHQLLSSQLSSPQPSPLALVAAALMPPAPAFLGAAAAAGAGLGAWPSSLASSASSSASRSSSSDTSRLVSRAVEIASRA